jgi:hypothetical protein
MLKAGIQPGSRMIRRMIWVAVLAVGSARISLGVVRENLRNRLMFLGSKNGHSGAKLLS